jgi:hypothetical protein
MTRAQAIEHNQILHEGLRRIAMSAEDEILGDEAARDAGVALAAHTLKCREENAR